MTAEEYLNNAKRIGELHVQIHEASEPLKEAGNKVASTIRSVVGDMIRGVSSKTHYLLSESIYSIGELPLPDNKVVSVVGNYDDESSDICLTYVDASGDEYDVYLPAEALSDETMKERLQHIVAGVIVAYLNREEDWAIDRRASERAQLAALEKDLETVQSASTRKVIEEQIAGCKSALENLQLKLKDFDLIKQRLLC